MYKDGVKSQAHKGGSASVKLTALVWLVNDKAEFKQLTLKRS